MDKASKTIQDHLSGKIPASKLVQKNPKGMVVNIKDIEKKVNISRKRAVVERKKTQGVQLPKQIGGVKIGKWNPQKVKFSMEGMSKGSFNKSTQSAKTAKKLLSKKPKGR